MSRRDRKRTRAPVRLASRPLRAGVSSSCHRPPRHHDRQWRQPCTGGGPTSAGIRYGKQLSLPLLLAPCRLALAGRPWPRRGSCLGHAPGADRLQRDATTTRAPPQGAGGGKKRTTATTRLCETPYFIRIERGQRVQSTQCTTLFSSALRLVSSKHRLRSATACERLPVPVL